MLAVSGGSRLAFCERSEQDFQALGREEAGCKGIQHEIVDLLDANVASGACRRSRAVSARAAIVGVAAVVSSEPKMLYYRSWPKNEPAAREGCGCGEIGDRSARAA